MKLTRRSFLGGAAGAVMVAGAMTRGAVFGANDRVVLGSIGVGNRGSGLARDFHGYDDVEIAAIADVDREAAESVAANVDGADIYNDYRELLERNDIDAVIIATPLHWHALHTIHAAQAGKDIYCEKCISNTIREGRLMMEAVRKYDVIFQTGSQQRSGQREYDACTHVRNGSIGDIVTIEAYNYHSPVEFAHHAEAIPDHVDWDLWLGPAPMHPYNFSVFDNRSEPSWSTVWPFSGGDMTDGGAHGLDMAQWGLGMDDSGPVEVWTEGEPFVRQYSTDDNPAGRHQGPRAPIVHMRYANGTVMELTGAPKFGVKFIGENGTIEVGRNHFDSDPPELMQEPLEDPDSELYHSEHHFRNWVDCVREHRDPVAPVEAGHRSANVCHLGNIARWVSEVNQATGEVLQWDPEAEEFTNSKIANYFLDTPRRAAFELPDSV
ncbi:MAG: Gfo/Idh/MocA family oxidoreductase [Candidatus Hydrogenedentota bacterium]